MSVSNSNRPATRSLAGQRDPPVDPSVDSPRDPRVDPPVDPLRTEEETGSRSPIPKAEAASPSPTDSLAEIRDVLRQLAALETARASASPAPVSIERYDKGPNARAPDPFTGKDRSKLRPFLSALRVVYLNHPSRFATDRNKVLYAGSLLTDVAAEWFEPFTLDTAEEAIVLDDWPLFVDRIESMFGDTNAEATAEFRLDALHMRENESISTYITKFRTLKAQLKWDDAPLRFAFRKGLAERVLDKLSLMETPPSSLSALIEAAQRIDNHHWDREREKKLLRSGKPSTAGQSGAPSTRSPSEGHGKNARRPYQPSNNSSEHSHKPKVPKKDLTKVLTKENKLTPAEKARRLEQGLCTYCGGPHKLEDCHVKPATSRARSVKIAESSTPDVVPGKA